MKKEDIFRLRKLLTLQQQAASLKYKKTLGDQKALRQRATDLVRQSYARTEQDGDEPTPGDLRAMNNYRTNLRTQAQSMQAAAALLDEPIENLRAKTTVALGREAAMEKLTQIARNEVRAQANEREEISREQLVLRNY